jgi:cell division protein FtsW
VKKTTITVYFLAIFIAVFGILIIFSVSAPVAQDKLNDSFYFVKKQSMWLFIALALQIFVMKLGYSKLYKFAPVLFKIGLLFLIIVLIPMFSTEIGGARRWIRICGIGFQPSEFMKIISIIFMARFLSDIKDDIKTFKQGFLKPFIPLLLIVVCILAGRDLGTSMIIACVTVAMFFVAGVKFRYLVGLVLSAVPFIGLAIYKYPFRMKRITAFLNPWSDPLNTSYQIIQSMVAITSGGLWGKGFGKGIQKYYYLPEAHTDFIFSIYAEETGLIGCIFLISLFVFLLFLCARITLRAKDYFGYLLGFGLTFLIAIQCIINIGVVTSILPTKGTPLPFISFGGSSLVVNMVAVGILISIERCSREERIKS